MRRLLLLITIGLVIFVFVFRQRIFLRDPLATVTRDGTSQTDVSVMINASNDVLVNDGSAGKQRICLVQNWNRVAGSPSAPLRCLRGMVCMTDANQASATPLVPGTRGRRDAFEGVTMTNRRVEFVDEDGALVLVKLR